MSTKTMWAPEFEAMPRAELRRLQDQRLREQVAWAYERSWLFRQRLDEAGVRPGDVAGVGQLTSVPILEEDLRVARAKTGDVFGGALCVPSADMVLITHSTGTSGRPNFYGLRVAGAIRTGDELCRTYAPR